MTELNNNISQHGSKPMDKISVLWPACLLFTSALPGACSPGLGPIAGAIVDAGDHDAPLSDVTVVLIRMHDVFALAEAASACVDLELTHSDAQGRFHFAKWSPPHWSLWDWVFPDSWHASLIVYKRDFESQHLGPKIAVGDHFEGLIRQQKIARSFDERTSYLLNVARSATCAPGELYRREMPLLRNLETDAASLAGTPEQLQYVNEKFYFAHLDARVSASKGSAPERPSVIHGPEPQPAPSDARTH
jgi:hypothetical protein